MVEGYTQTILDIINLWRQKHLQQAKKEDVRQVAITYVWDG
jgi:hypothetical protein